VLSGAGYNEFAIILKNVSDPLLSHLILLSRSKEEVNHRITVELRSPDMSFRSVESATGVWCLASGLAVDTSMCARSRLPVAHGPDSRHHTPLATIVLPEHFDGCTTGVSRAGVGSDCQDRERQGCRDPSRQGCPRGESWQLLPTLAPHR